MSENSFTQIESQSWFGRIGGAIKGLFIGIILVVLAFPVLFFNEGRAVKREKSLNEGAGAVQSISPEQVNPSHEGKLVHMTGTAETKAILSDSTFGVSGNALKLRRVAEMYQWIEKEKSTTDKKVGGGSETKKTYSYSKEWSNELVKSSSFKKPQGHENPLKMPYDGKRWTANKVSLGAFTLSKAQLKMLDHFQPMPIPADTPIPQELIGKAQLVGDEFYIGKDPNAPEIGDIRVRFEIIEPGEISLVAKQAGNTFDSYMTKAGGEITLLEDGTHSAQAMFQTAQQENTIITWIIRAGGLILMFIGFTMFFRVLSVLADVLPIFGSIVSVGTGIIAFLLSAVLSLLTISVAWIFYRPVLGILLLTAAIAIGILIVNKLKQKRVAAPI